VRGNTRTTIPNGWKKIGNDVLPRVTTILGETGDNSALEGWKNRETREGRDWNVTLEQAALEGTLFHYRILNKMSPVQLPLRDDIPIDRWPRNIVRIMEQREQQFKDLELKIGWPRLIEHPVKVNGEFGYCGTLDLEAPIDGPTRIADLKRSRRPVKKHEYQLGGYYLARKLAGGKATEGMIIYARPYDVEVVELENDEMEELASVFVDYTKEFYRKHGKATT